MKYSQKIFILFMVVIFVSACGSTEAGPAVQTIISDQTVEHSALQYYFTRPGIGNDCELGSNLVYDIDQANESIDLAMYNINLVDVTAALIRAHKRGIDVRIVLDDDKENNAVPKTLFSAGVPVVSDPDKSTMHNKFMVIDHQIVWTGSMNFTDSGCTDDYNNMVRVENERLAANYEAEFAEMFEEHRFSADSPENTPYRQVQVGNVLIETYFSPDDGVRNAMIDVIDDAKSSIVIMAYSFTSDDLADAIVDRYEDGVAVYGVMDAEQIESNSGGEYETFLKHRMDIRQDDIPGQMHHKVIIIDEEIVITGSYNFSGNAENRNDENVLIIHSSEAAEQFLQAYEMIKVK